MHNRVDVRLRYLIVWGLSRGLDAAILASTIIFIGFEFRLIGWAVGLLVDGLTDFTGQRYWVFREQRRNQPLLQALFKYVLARGLPAAIAMSAAEYVSGGDESLMLLFTYIGFSLLCWILQIALMRWVFVGKIRDFHVVALNSAKNILNKANSI